MDFYNSILCVKFTPNVVTLRSGFFINTNKQMNIKQIFSRRLFHLHKWQDNTDYSFEMTPTHDGQGYCQRWITMKCKKCGKEKSFFGDIHLGMNFTDI